MIRVLLKTAQGGHVEPQGRGDGDVKAKPGNGDCTQDVSVTEREHATAGGLTEADETEPAGIDLSWGLPAWTSVFEQLPARLPFLNLRGGDPFVCAVIEFAKQ